MINMRKMLHWASLSVLVMVVCFSYNVCTGVKGLKHAASTAVDDAAAKAKDDLVFRDAMVAITNWTAMFDAFKSGADFGFSVATAKGRREDLDWLVPAFWDGDTNAVSRYFEAAGYRLSYQTNK